MRDLVVLLALFLKLMPVENRMIVKTDAVAPFEDTEPTADEHVYEHEQDHRSHEKVIGLKSTEDGDHPDDEDSYDMEKKLSDEIKKQCAIVVLSNVQNQNVRSLLRKYRYDADGALIPSSVKYFIKLPQSSHSEPILVPVNDKAFSPMGGFVRYYKEVPPIPRNW